MYDLIVIGWGKAGKTLANKLGSQGQKIALIEKDPKMYGGTCINVGCLPTKSLVHDAKVVSQMRSLGIENNHEVNNAFFKKAMEHKKNLVKKLNKVNFDILKNNLNVDLYLGDASFESENSIKVRKHDNQEIILEAKKILINTGATPNKLSIEGSESKNILTSEQLLELDELPKDILVIGAGFIGLEFASIFNYFGSNVQIFQKGNMFLPSEDQSDADAIKESLTKRGVKIDFDIDLIKFVDLKNNKTKVVYSQNDQIKEAVFDKILVAIGRRPNTEGLSLEKANIQINERGIIISNNLLQTTNKNVYVAGDVKGGYQFTYISLDDSRIIYPQLANLETSYTKDDRKYVPFASFIDPTYARAGLNEKEAKAKGIEYTLKYLPSLKIPKAHVIRETEGYYKVLVDKEGYIIGAIVFNYEAHEIINLLSVAIKYKIKASDLKDFIYVHPNFTEALNDVLS
ncbi:dihydrolipoyl dehydrogenase family protein [Mycoplasmopsis gallinacea]|uniref:FAD-dependent oxidoreductase n=1 Tax=Mycoplasmopsis gallinacea TaxID=29556 RepID=A0A6H0V391_9BACT|nr:NAD(P)/FAD-dependent oxidoreductase [Mycoplasmopsis gallinacea]QIW61946.1 FAD-dependent oxidoreductase [Mycoplasmopsis gallinacea]